MTPRNPLADTLTAIFSGRVTPADAAAAADELRRERDAITPALGVLESIQAGLVQTGVAAPAVAPAASQAALAAPAAEPPAKPKPKAPRAEPRPDPGNDEPPAAGETPDARRVKVAKYLLRNGKAQACDLVRNVPVPAWSIKGILAHEWFEKTGQRMRDPYDLTPTGREAVRAIPD